MIVIRRGRINIALRVLLFTNSLVLLASFLLGPIYALFVEELGGNIMDAGLTAGVFAVAGGITAMISGVYSDKVKESELVIVLGYFVMGSGFFLMNFAYSVSFLFITQALIGFGESIYSPAFSAVYSKHLTKDRAGTEWGLWEIINYFTYAVGAMLGAYLATVFGFKSLFNIMGCLCMASGLYIYALPRKVL